MHFPDDDPVPPLPTGFAFAPSKAPPKRWSLPARTGMVLLCVVLCCGGMIQILRSLLDRDERGPGALTALLSAAMALGGYGALRFFGFLRRRLAPDVPQESNDGWKWWRAYDMVLECPGTLEALSDPMAKEPEEAKEVFTSMRAFSNGLAYEEALFVSVLRLEMLPDAVVPLDNFFYGAIGTACGQFESARVVSDPDEARTVAGMSGRFARLVQRKEGKPPLYIELASTRKGTVYWTVRAIYTGEAFARDAQRVFDSLEVVPR